MRIQHNITAMNAYRNYNTNTSALSKNLEKLSSGYKINRAGDDAAGLAISEKMRAQITGLNAASKNVKDGISLVKTAEGAMQEIQDMLNRMDYLATQSANGTYDNEVDRANLQKEVDNLKTEINRIADSANFNGIKLLDGSLDGSGKAAVEATESTASGMLPDVGNILGKDTVLHAEAGQAAANTTMSVDLHNLAVNGTKGQSFTIDVGGTKLIGTLQGDFSNNALTAQNIADALGNGTTTNVSFAYEDGTAYSNAAVKFGTDGAEFTATATGNRITFTQNNPDDVDFDPELKVSVSAGTAKATEIATATTTPGTAAGTTPTVTVTPPTATTATVTQGNNTAGTKASIEIDLAGAALDKEASKLTLSFGTGLTVDSAAVADADKADATKLAAAFNGKTITVDGQTLTATVTGTTVKFEAATAVDSATAATWTAITNGTLTATGKAGAAAVAAKTEVDFTGKTGKDVIGGTLTVGDKTYEFTKTGGTATGTNTKVDIAENATAAEIAAALQLAAAAANPTDVTPTSTGNKVTFTADNAGTADNAKVATTVGKAGGDPKLSGDYNVSTTNIAKKGEAAGERLASTYFNLSAAMAANGNQITIGKTTYTFTTDEADKGKLDANADNKVYVGDLDLSKKEDLIEAADRLTKVANGNSTYTVGHDGTRMTFTEVKGQTDFVEKDGTTSSLTNLKAIEESFGFKTAAQAAVAEDDSKSLTLQIGDTSESFNQMKVQVGDMHTDAMGTGTYLDENGKEVKITKTIADIDISNQAGAAEAINVIKNAINYVSGVRGDLGAVQNRLEHTQNNLSVMAENIQDAESTIRDTDVAEEMMSYVKNNILVQSAQAMLAQANQVPQGVLQLLG